MPTVDQEKPVRLLTVYVVRGKRKPIKTDLTVNRDKVWPKTVKYDGTTFYFTNADFVGETITFVSVDPNWVSTNR